MYKIAGITYFEESDNDQDLVRGYYETQKKRFDENFKSIPEEVRNYNLDQTVQGIIERLENDNDPSYRSMLVYVINNLNTMEFINPYEDHWLKFLSSMQFDPSIISYDILGAISTYINTSPDLKDDKELLGFLSGMNDSRYLKINKKTNIVTSDGLQYGLNDDIVKLFMKQFPGSVEDDTTVSVKYAPSQDVSVPLLLNRYLHLLL